MQLKWIVILCSLDIVCCACFVTLRDCYASMYLYILSKVVFAVVLLIFH